MSPRELFDRFSTALDKIECVTWRNWRLFYEEAFINATALAVVALLIGVVGIVKKLLVLLVVSPLLLGVVGLFFAHYLRGYLRIVRKYPPRRSPVP